MTTIINGDSPSITFSDGTTQTSAFNGKALSTSPYTTLLGASALASNTGTFNTAIGYQAGYAGTTAKGNTLIGTGAGVALTTGSRNTFIGPYWDTYSAGVGQLITTGSNNTVVGLFDGNSGGLDIRTASNYIVLADGSGNPRLINDGTSRILINQLSTVAGADGTFTVTSTSGSNQPAGTFRTYDGASQYTGVIYNAATSGNNAFLLFGTEASFTSRGSITYNRGAGLVAYNVTSDHRAKTIDGNIENALDDVNLIKTHKATMNGATISMPMFVAHELAEVAPYCVTGEKDAIDEEGNPKYQQVDSSPLIPLLVKAIQELNAKVDAQAAEIVELKAKP